MKTKQNKNVLNVVLGYWTLLYVWHPISYPWLVYKCMGKYIPFDTISTQFGHNFIYCKSTHLYEIGRM